MKSFLEIMKDRAEAKDSSDEDSGKSSGDEELKQSEVQNPPMYTLSTGEQVREFRRFKKFGHDSWYVTLDDSNRPDAIIFQAKKDVRIYGVGIYGPKDEKKHKLYIKYRWII